MNAVADGAREITFGTFVPQGWKLEYAGWGAEEAWARTREVARIAERGGYGHLWVYDHVETVPRREPSHVFEAYTMLAALAMVTETVKLGEMVTCSSYRNAGLLAKQAACIDVYSGGRFILGIGAGWFWQEYQAYGWEFMDGRERLRMLDETIDVVRGLWREDTFSYDGTYLHFDGAYCDPKPLQDLPEIWIGGGGEQVTLRIAARQADKTNWQVGLDGFVRKSTLLERYCDEIGRDFASITRTHGPDCRIFDTEAELAAWLAEPDGGHLWGKEDPAVYAAENLVGTVEQVAEKTQAFVDAGCDEFVLWFRDFPSTESMERFIGDVAPRITG